MTRLYRTVQQATGATIKVSVAPTVEYVAGKNPNPVKISVQEDPAAQAMVFENGGKLAQVCRLPKA